MSIQRKNMIEELVKRIENKEPEEKLYKLLLLKGYTRHRIREYIEIANSILERECK